MFNNMIFIIFRKMHYIDKKILKTCIETRLEQFNAKVMMDVFSLSIIQL